MKKAYCTTCACLDCSVAGANCSGSCGTANFKGDGFCDDNNNNCGCAWDGGDCCGSTGKAKQFNYCTACKCLDPTELDTGCTGACWKTAYADDGFCDDQNNNCGCSWDGGDCCGGKTNYCTRCLCLDPDFVAGGCTSSCSSPGYYDDGFCDDNNNNCGCGWDGGDCCGNSGKAKQFSYCTACNCLDPVALAGTCNQGCGSPGYYDDGFCDDNNNNCGCGWDGGDCCGNSGKAKQFSYCTACKCLDPVALAGSCDQGCGSPTYVDDGFCDDNNNNCGCGWDGGDCCGSSGKAKQFNYCTECDCLDPDAYCISTCGAAAYYDDGFCDDSNNNCGCGWDGGDCCGSSGKAKQFSYCSVCACIDSAVGPPALGCDGACGSQAYVADGWCDDNNNNCACSWDGGDCCGSTGETTQFNYCTVCKCLDPTLAAASA